MAHLFSPGFLFQKILVLISSIRAPLPSTQLYERTSRKSDILNNLRVNIHVVFFYGTRSMGIKQAISWFVFEGGLNTHTLEIRIKFLVEIWLEGFLKSGSYLLRFAAVDTVTSLILWSDGKPFYFRCSGYFEDNQRHSLYPGHGRPTVSSNFTYHQSGSIASWLACM